MEHQRRQNVPGDGLEQVEVSSPWFKMKIDDISWKTIIVVGMILASIVSIVYILAN